MTPAILENKCDGLCNQLCGSYLNIENLDKEKTKCLLLCGNLNLASDLCDTLCKTSISNKKQDKIEINSGDENGNGIDRPVNYKNGCIGYGREVCYKACRLFEKESINVCLCACCKCKF
jgi:hypothetical protein